MTASALSVSEIAARNRPQTSRKILSVLR